MSIQEQKLAAIADAIRDKKGTHELIAANNFAEEIKSIMTLSEYYLEYWELSKNGPVLARIPIKAGDVVTLKEGQNIAECNIGTRDYIPTLTFQGWASPFEVVDGAITIPECLSSDVTITASYIPADGKDTFVMMSDKANENKGYLKINLSATGDGVTYVDWGDGPIQEVTTTIAGDVGHQYAKMGFKTVKVWTSANRSVIYGSVVLAGHNPGAFGTCNRNPIAAFFSSIDSLAARSFEAGNQLKIITLPLGTTKIVDKVFFGCSCLEYVSIPPSVSSIGNMCMYECSLLKRITIPYTINTLGSHSFARNHSLKSIVLPQSIVELSNVFMECHSLENISILASSIRFGGGCFSKCYNLKTNMSAIAARFVSSNSFEYCYLITAIPLPREEAPWIYAHAFKHCISITKIVLPKHISGIHDYAFNGCINLASITCKNLVPPTLGADVFTSINYTKIGRIYVPAESFSAYENATNWTTLSPYMYKDTLANREMFGD